MIAGFQAWTDSGLVQIDGTTQNYALRQTIIVTTSTGGMDAGRANDGTQYTLYANVATLTISAVQPLIALYSPNAYATILKCINNGSSSWTVQIWTNVAATLSVYVFDQSMSAAPSGVGFGIQVFDASSNLIADGRQRLARVLDNQSGNIMNAGPGWGQWNQLDTQNLSWSYSGPSKLGVAAIGTAWVGKPTGGNNNGWYNISGFQTVGNTINFQWQYYQVGNAYHPATNPCFGSQYDWRFMAIDLSNI